jgi:hypothetical protein
VIDEAKANPSAATARRWMGQGIVIGAQEGDGPECAAGPRDRRHSLFGRRAHQRDCRTMAHKLWQLRIVPKPQREHVPGATVDDGFPPPVVEGFLGEDEMARRDLVPGPG